MPDVGLGTGHTVTAAPVALAAASELFVAVVSDTGAGGFAVASSDACLNPGSNPRGSLFGPGLDRLILLCLLFLASPADLIFVLRVSENMQRQQVS